MSVKCLLIIPKWLFFRHVKAELIKLAGMAGVMHEADHAYSIWSTWWLHWLAADVLSIVCVINWQSIFVNNLDLSNFSPRIWIALFWFLSICLLLVYFVSAAGCPCFDLLWMDHNDKKIQARNGSYTLKMKFISTACPLFTARKLSNAHFFLLGRFCYITAYHYCGFRGSTSISTKHMRKIFQFLP